MISIIFSIIMPFTLYHYDLCYSIIFLVIAVVSQNIYHIVSTKVYVITYIPFNFMLQHNLCYNLFLKQFLLH